MTTEILDKLYLEWSQFTKCRTAREIAYRVAITNALDELRHVGRTGEADSMLATVLKDWGEPR